ncbi:MAG: glycosyltransferase [Chloroflexi bacterium]|nr:glycosyltransferase [Chloroflexota bacterium]
MVLVSVIMSSYNYEKYIAESIESVLNQTFRDLELIIVDDGSTDSSPQIIADYQKKDPRIHAIFHQKNMGIAKTLNDCLNQARGNFISFIDADDLWVESKLEKQVAVLKKDDTLLVWSEGEIVNSEGIKTGQMVTKFLNAPINKNGNLFQELLREQFVFRQSLIFKSDFIKNIRFDSALRYVNDHRFIVDLSLDNHFLFMPEPLAKYRLHDQEAGPSSS